MFINECGLYRVPGSLWHDLGRIRPCPRHEERCIRSYAEALYSAVLSEGRSGPSPALEIPGWFHPGPLRKRVWCGRRDLNPHGTCAPTDFLTLYDFRRPAGKRVQGTLRQVCGLDYTFTVTVRSVAVRR